MKFKKLTAGMLCGIMLFGNASTKVFGAQTTGIIKNNLIEDLRAESAVNEPEYTEENQEIDSEETVNVVNKQELEVKPIEKKPVKKEATTPAANNVKTKSTAKATSYTNTDLRLMSCIIYSEAGSEPYAGKLAVGIVVQNRKQSRSFPNSIYSVIYEPRQFGPARNGSLSRALNKYDSGRFNDNNEKDSIKAAKEALSEKNNVVYKGKNLDLSKYLYFNGRVNGAKLQIANHQFK